MREQLTALVRALSEKCDAPPRVRSSFARSIIPDEKVQEPLKEAGIQTVDIAFNEPEKPLSNYHIFVPDHICWNPQRYGTLCFFILNRANKLKNLLPYLWIQMNHYNAKIFYCHAPFGYIYNNHPYPCL